MVAAINTILSRGWEIHFRDETDSDGDTRVWITRPKMTDGGRIVSWTHTLRYDALGDVVTCVDQLSVLTHLHENFPQEMPKSESTWTESEGWK